MKLVVITGMSGSGKTHALHILEDLGYYCIDNIPVSLIKTLITSVDYENTAVVCDIRTGDMDKLIATVNSLRGHIIFLDTEDEAIIKRYKETRRTHPRDTGEGLIGAIAEERRELSEVKANAQNVIDTTRLSLGELRGELMSAIGMSETASEFEITVTSFGFKNGTPADADMVFDVRCFPNPFYEENLKHKTGNDKEVQAFVMAHESAREYLSKLSDLTKFIVPIFKSEGRYSLIIAIGCTGGHHRSVTFANLLSGELKSAGYSVKTLHRDIMR